MIESVQQEGLRHKRIFDKTGVGTTLHTAFSVDWVCVLDYVLSDCPIDFTYESTNNVGELRRWVASELRHINGNYKKVDRKRLKNG